MPSIAALAVRHGARRFLKPAPADPAGVVRHLRRRSDAGRAPAPLPRGVAVRPVPADELGGAVAGLWVGVPAARRTVVYLHGGAYVAGTPATYRTFAGRLAAALRADVLLVDYRLAPEHPFPAAVIDGVAAVRAVVAAGADPASVAVVGDSAGGGLTLATLVQLRDEGGPMPAAAVAISPWADLTVSSTSALVNDEADDLLTARTLAVAAELYLDGADPGAPTASPARAALDGLPPLLITADRREVLVDDVRAVAARAEAAGVPVRLIESEGLFHASPVLAPFVPESRRQADHLVDFLDAALGRA